MSDFSGTIFKEGISSAGYYYSKEVLQDVVDKFNMSEKCDGVLGCISVQSPPPLNLDEKSYISHATTSLTFDGEKVEANINILDNEYGKQLLALLANVPEKLKVTPLISGTTDGIEVKSACFSRVDFTYDKSGNNA